MSKADLEVLTPPYQLMGQKALSKKKKKNNICVPIRRHVFVISVATIDFLQDGIRVCAHCSC